MKDFLTINEQFNLNAADIPNVPTPTTLSEPTRSFSVWGDKMPEDSVKIPQVIGAISKQRAAMMPAINSFANQQFAKARQQFNQSFGVGKIRMSSHIPMSQTHDILNDGKTFIPKYNVYKEGVDNNEYNALGQTTGDKLFNTVFRTGKKVIRGAVMDLLSMPAGAIEAIVKGNSEYVFNGTMSRYVDDLDKITDAYHRNFYTKDQIKEGMGFNMKTFDDIAKGSEFTFRMLGSDAILSMIPYVGTGLVAAKRVHATGRVMNYVDKMADVIKTGKGAKDLLRVASSSFGDIARGAKTVSTSAQGMNVVNRLGFGAKLKGNIKDLMYPLALSSQEAGFEARHYKESAVRDFYDYHAMNGTEPTTEEINDFYKKLDDTTWNVYGSNLAILYGSNAMMFPKIMGVNNPFVKLSNKAGNAVSKKMFGMGTVKGADGVWSAIKANKFQKIGGYVAPFVKNAAVEGVFEEGSQGVVTDMFSNYMKSSYDKTFMQDARDYTDFFVDSFKRQYIDGEGHHEMAIGAIIGGLFGVGSVRSTARGYAMQNSVANVQNQIDGYSEIFKNNLYTNENLVSQIGNLSRQFAIEKSSAENEKRGDVVSQKLNDVESVVSLLQSSYSVGKDDYFRDTFLGSVEGMDVSKIMENYGVTEDQAIEIKNDIKSGMSDLMDSYDKHRSTAEALFRDGDIGGFVEHNGQKVNTRQLVDGFAYLATMSSYSEKAAKDYYDMFQNRLSEMMVATETRNKFGSLVALQNASKDVSEKYESVSKEYKAKLDEKNELENKILDLQSALPENSADTLQKLGKELTNLNNELAKLSSEKDLLWKGITDNFYAKLGQTGTLPQTELDEFDNTVDEIRSILDNNTSLSLADRNELISLLDAQQRSSKIHRDFNTMTNALANKDFKFKGFRGVFSGARAKSDKSLNDLTREALISMYEAGVSAVDMSNFANKKSLVTDEIIESLSKDDVEVDGDIATDIALKLRDGKSLTKNEELYYEKFKDYVDQRVKDLTEEQVVKNNDPLNNEVENDSVTSKINALEKKRWDIVTGILPVDVEAKIQIIDDKISKAKTDEEIVELEKEKAEIIDKLLKDIDTEIAILSGKITNEDLINGEIADIVDEIAEIDERIKTETGDVKNASIKRRKELTKRYLELKKELSDNTKKDISSDMTFDEQIQWVVDNYSDLGFKSEDVVKGISKPSEEDVERFKQLRAKKDLTEDEQKELDTLTESFKLFRLAENIDLDGRSLFDILTLSEEISKVNNIDNSQDVSLPEGKMTGVISRAEKMEAAYGSNKVTNVYDSAFVSSDNSGNTYIHHIKVGTILKKAVSKGLPISIMYKGAVVQMPTDGIDKFAENFEENTDFEIKIDDVTLTRTPKGRLKYEGDLLDLLDLRAFSIKGGSNYQILYDKKSDGTWSNAASDFAVYRGSKKPVVFDVKTLHDLAKDDDVELFYDVRDSYNKSIEGLGKVERVNKAQIYVMKKGRVVGILPAIQGDVDAQVNGDSVVSKLKKIRRAVIDYQKPIPIKVETNFIGLPKMKVDDNGRAITTKIDESKVVSYGYVTKDSMVFFDKVEPTDTKYTDAIASDDKIVPIVAFKHGKKIHTFPIRLETTAVDLTSEYDKIMSDLTLTSSEKATEVQKLLGRVNGVDGAKLKSDEDIRNSLANAEIKSDITDKASFMSMERSTFIDLNDPFLASKLKLNLDSFEEPSDLKEVSKENQKKNSKTVSTSNRGKKKAEEKSCS